VAYLGWLEEASFRWSAVLLIQDGHYSHHLEFGFRQLKDKCLCRLIWFLCVSLGWREEGSFRWSAPSLIQDCRHLGFRFRRLEDKRLGWLIQFFCGSLGVIRGRFLSMISSAAHPGWPSSWIWFPSIIWWTPVDWSDFLVPHWGVINLHHVPLLPKPHHPHTHRQRPNRGHMPRLALPLLQIESFQFIAECRPYHSWSHIYWK
jgi:hypothetical protein